MKKISPLLIAIVIILIIAGLWLVITSQSKKEQTKLNQQERLEIAEHLERWQLNCENDGGIWFNEYEMCFNEEKAQKMKDSCEQFNGVWIEDSMLYECAINGDVFQLGEWEMIAWETYEETKKSCFDYDGEWLGGADLACSLDGVVYKQGSWELMDEMEESCTIQFGGEWLGGADAECKIDDIVYPGNWVQILAMKDSCEDLNGAWLGGSENACQIDGFVYQNNAWSQLEDMRSSCLEDGGEFLAGPDFECRVYNGVYKNKEWVRMAQAPSMADRCQADGGTWLEERRTCQGLPLEWCLNIESELEEIRGLGWNENSLSCYIY